MRAMDSQERAKRERARDEKLMAMGFGLVHTNTIGVHLDNCVSGVPWDRDCVEIEVNALVYPDDKIMQVILQKVFDAGVKTGRANLQTALNNLLKPDTED